MRCSGPPPPWLARVAERMFKAIVLDLFDTLVNWDPDGLPLMHWKGRDIHSTIPWILPKVAEALGAKYDREAFMTAYGAVYDEINHERERDGIEITCFERFVRTLQRLGLEDGGGLAAAGRRADPHPYAWGA